MPFGQGRSGGGGGGRGGDKKAGDKEKGQRRPMFRRRKVCKFCADKIDDINYKDVKLLGPFVPERGKILPRRISGTCAMHQRKLQTAIKRARQIALIPYVTDNVRRDRRSESAAHREVTWKSFCENTSTISAAAAKSSRSPTATRATTCCRASWRCSRPKATRSRSSASARSSTRKEAEEQKVAEAMADAAGRRRDRDRAARSARPTRCSGR